MLVFILIKSGHQSHTPLPQLCTIISRHKLIGMCLGRPALVVTLPEHGPCRAQSGKPAWGLIGSRAGPHLQTQHCMGMPEQSPRRARVGRTWANPRHNSALCFIRQTAAGACTSPAHAQRLGNAHAEPHRGPHGQC